MQTEVTSPRRATPHICLVTDFAVVLDGRVLNQAYTLSRAGYRVSVVDQSLPQTPEPLATLYGRLPTWLTRSCRFIRIATGDEGFPIRLFSALQKPARPLARYLVSRCLLRLHADVYQARSLETLRTLLPAVRWTRAKLLYDVRDFDTPFMLPAQLPGSHRRALEAEPRAMPYVSALTTVNASLAEAIARHYHVATPDVIFNCKLVGVKLPPQVADLRTELSLPPATPLLVFTGTTSAGRSLPVILAAIGRVPGVHLAFVGLADRSGELARLAEDAGARGRVSFHPPVSAYEVPAYIRSADADIACIEPVNPNHASALPNKVFEAVAAHLPLIASDLPEMRRVVETYQLGAVFNPSDVDDLVRAIGAVLSQRDLFRRHAVTACSELSWESQEPKLLAVYRRLVGAP